MTPQEQRDQDYLEGYGVGLSHTLSHQELTGHTIAFVRGYRDGQYDALAMETRGGEPA